MSISEITPSSSAVAVSLSADTSFSSPPRAVYVGTGGNLKVDMVGGQAITFTNVQDGFILPIRVTKVYSTANGTTASDIVVLN